MQLITNICSLISRFSYIQRYYSGVATVLMLHRVAYHDSKRLFPNENLKVSPLFLEEYIVSMIRDGYTFVSLDELYDALISNKKFNKFLVLTFDDGYADNYTYAFPILNAYGIPFTVYISSLCPERRARIWWYAVEDIILKNSNILFGGYRYSCAVNQEKINAFYQIRSILIRARRFDFEMMLSQFEQVYNISWIDICEELMMSWDQIRELSRSSLCLIGGHSNSHYVFRQCKREEIIQDIEVSNKLLAAKIDYEIEHFAYPFGGREEVDLREVEIVKELNFKTAVTTRPGNIYTGHKNYLNCLPRFMFANDFSMDMTKKIRRKRFVTL